MLWWAVRIVIAVVIVALVVRFVLGSLGRYFSGARLTGVPAPETLPVGDADIRFRCENCGLEVLVTELPELDDRNEMPPLRHCREEMELVSEADAEVEPGRAEPEPELST